MTRVPSCVQGDNDKLMETIAPLYLPADAVVLDLTFGEGVFWKRYRPPLLLTNNRDPAAGTDYHDDFRCTALADACADVVVLDPAYVSTGGRETSTLAGIGSDLVERYDMGTTEKSPWAQHVRVMMPALMEAERLAVPGGRVLVKAQDYVTGGHMQEATQWAKEAGEHCGLVWHGDVVCFTGLRPQPLKNPKGTPREQQHAHGAHSVLVVFDKPTKLTSKPRR